MANMLINRIQLTLFVILSMAPSSYSQDSDGLSKSSAPLLTIEDAVYLAKWQNTEIKLSALEIDKAVQQTIQQKMLKLPTFTIYTTMGISPASIAFTIPRGSLGSYPTIGPVPNEDAVIRTPAQTRGVIYGVLTQPITKLHNISLGVKAGQLSEALARERLRNKHQMIIQQVKQAYYLINQLECSVASTAVTITYLEELSYYTERNRTLGIVLKTETADVTVRLTQAKYTMLCLRDNLNTQKEGLNRLLGRDLNTAFVTQLPPYLQEEMSLPAAQSVALQQRSEVRQARLQAQSAELAIRRERAEYIPDLSAQVSYVSFLNIDPLPRNLVTAGFTLQWQPFDWGLKRHKGEELRSVSMQASLTARDVREQILLNVAASFRKLAESRAFLEVAAATQEMEREKLRIILNRYRERANLLTDTLAQQSLLAQADARYQQALAEFWTAKAAFNNALGDESDSAL
jgi:outer membrane protein TolC